MNLALIKACKLPLALFAGVLVACSAAAMMAHHTLETAQARQAQATHEAAARARARSQETADRAELAALEARLPALQNRGLFTAENRLDWVESLNRFRTTRELAGINYEIGPQQAADPALTGPAGGRWQWQMSPMRIQLAALHEGDVLALIDHLRRTTTPWLHIQRCSLTRATTPRPHGPAAQIAAECELAWIGVQPKTP